MNLPNLLAHHARKFPDKEAIVTPTERLTYKEWDRCVNKLAHSLRELGISRGDKVVLHMPNTKEFLITYFAVQRLGALIVPINARFVAHEIDYILENCEARMFITHNLVFNQVAGLGKKAGVTFVKTGESETGWYSWDGLLEKGSEEEIFCPLHEDDEASILYTSGTTGKPKGVVFTYRNILDVASMICIEMDVKPDSRILHMMPLSHSAPLHLFMGAGIYTGATHVAVPTFSPELLLETIERERITHFFGAPIAYLSSARHPNIHTYDLSSMVTWVYGGAPLAPKEVEFLKTVFTTGKLVGVYGLTEAGPNGTLLEHEEHDEKAGSIGRRAALHCEIRIVDENGNDVKPGEVGEIILRSEGNMKGYYNDPVKTQETLKDGWIYTGDLARQDEDGYFWVVDRKKAVIISGGVNVYPKEIEDLLIEHPKIADVAVIGVPHPDWGETVKAFVVLKEDMVDVEQECKAFLQGKLADYKIPKLYEVVVALPRNATGKILKNQLRQQVQQQ